jgi:choline kinase
LLRIYGPSSDSLISRTRELRTLHLISTRYNIGPRIYGTFENGRIEEYFNSVALTPTDIRDPQISGWIAARMAELHSVDITDIDNITFGGLNAHGPDDLYSRTRRFEIATSVKSWLDPAEKVLALPGVAESLRHELDLPRFRYEWEKYLAWVLARPKTFGTRRVFAHSDAQYGNLLRLKDGSEGADEHRQV